MGALVVRPFRTDENFTIFVNCGWIPEDMTDTIPPIKKGHQEVVGLVKLDENKEIKRTTYMYPLNDKIHNLIDLEHFSKLLNLKPEETETNGFIERIIADENDKSHELYPVLQTSKSFSRPYLTPRRHVEYATFWGLTASLGIGSILAVLLKK